MAVYSDAEGWQNNQFLGMTEFALPFGNYDVEIAVPADNVVGASGVLVNAEEVLFEEQLKRLEAARISLDKPVLIVSQEKAEKAEKNRSTDKLTWKYRAENVGEYIRA